MQEKISNELKPAANQHAEQTIRLTIRFLAFEGIER